MLCVYSFGPQPAFLRKKKVREGEKLKLKSAKAIFSMAQHTEFVIHFSDITKANWRSYCKHIPYCTSATGNQMRVNDPVILFFLNWHSINQKELLGQCNCCILCFFFFKSEKGVIVGIGVGINMKTKAWYICRNVENTKYF
uniref:Uncharacterized protein n=1 Tax=Sphaerodactylus townsendi TaxID=933632 RepID=A0ACB8ESQ5_9SAUR